MIDYSNISALAKDGLPHLLGGGVSAPASWCVCDVQKAAGRRSEEISLEPMIGNESEGGWWEDFGVLARYISSYQTRNLVLRLAIVQSHRVYIMPMDGDPCIGVNSSCEGFLIADYLATLELLTYTSPLGRPVYLP